MSLLPKDIIKEILKYITPYKLLDDLEKIIHKRKLKVKIEIKIIFRQNHYVPYVSEKQHLLLKTRNELIVRHYANQVNSTNLSKLSSTDILFIPDNNWTYVNKVENLIFNFASPFIYFYVAKCDLTENEIKILESYRFQRKNNDYFRLYLKYF